MDRPKDILHKDMANNSLCMCNNSDPVVEGELEPRDFLPGKS
jgi:hypothetical protein